MKKVILFLLFVWVCSILRASAQTAKMPERICISANHRYLVDEQGLPFFYLADTAWELFHRLSREEADMYLKDRARKGFTVIQAVAIAELVSFISPNPGEELDWVLVIDDASKKYKRP